MTFHSELFLWTLMVRWIFKIFSKIIFNFVTHPSVIKQKLKI